MNTVLKLGSKDDVFKNAFAGFSRQCMTADSGLAVTKNQFRDIRDLFIHSGQAEDFCDRTIKLSHELQNSGKTKLGDLLINEISKLCVNLNMNQKAEKLLYETIENCRKKNDGLHELARLTDLEYLYKAIYNRKGLFSILHQKKDCCKRIIANYETNVKNYDSIVKKPTTKKDVQIQLAYTYSELAELLERNKPKDAVKLYEKAKDIYKALKQTREENYLQERIRRIKVRHQIK